MPNQIDGQLPDDLYDQMLVDYLNELPDYSNMEIEVDEYQDSGLLIEDPDQINSPKSEEFAMVMGEVPILDLVDLSESETPQLVSPKSPAIDLANPPYVIVDNVDKDSDISASLRLDAFIMLLAVGGVFFAVYYLIRYFVENKKRHRAEYDFEGVIYGEGENVVTVSSNVSSDEKAACV